MKKYYINFVDEIVKFGSETQKEICGRYVIARPMSFSGVEGIKKRIYSAIQILKGKAVAVRYIETEKDLLEIQNKHKLNGVNNERI
jgi:hypothetical protein